VYLNAKADLDVRNKIAIVATMSGMALFDYGLLEDEKLSLESWPDYPLNLSSTSSDLIMYDEMLKEMTSILFCEEDSATNVSIIDVQGMFIQT
jgi:hypothetical protein